VVPSRAYSKTIIEVGELDPERGNVNDCAVDEVLRRHNPDRIGDAIIARLGSL